MMRRVCVFCETWESGGIESFLCNALLGMDRSGLTVDILAAELRESVFTDPLRKAGVRVEELSGSTLRLWENHRLFRRLLRERRYDVLYVNAYQGMSLYYARIAAQEGVPVRIAHSHNTALRKSLTKPLKLLLHRLFSRLYTASATELWACSGEAAAFLFPKRALSCRGYRFIPNGIDTERFRFHADEREKLRRELGLEGRFVIGQVGRLCYQKNQSFTLRTFSALLRLRPESLLLLVGEGPDRAMLEREADELGLGDRVLFYGTSQQVQRLFWAMDASIFPSRFEGFGIVAVEAQAAGLPVLCSEHVASEAIVTPLSVQMCLSEGSERWAERLSGLAAAEREAAASAVAEAGFDIRAVSGQISAAFRD